MNNEQARNEYLTEVQDGTGLTLVDIMYECDNYPESVAHSSLCAQAQVIHDDILDGAWDEELITETFAAYHDLFLGES